LLAAAASSRSSLTLITAADPHMLDGTARHKAR
jgi:hypothetical protein